MTLVFLLDVDNTLLDNDRMKSDLARRIEELVGPQRAERFWEIYEEVRTEEDYVDYPTTVRRWTQETGDEAMGNRLQGLLDAIDFPSYLYPHAMDTLAFLRTLGTTIILSDGDRSFQPYKIKRSGLEQAVGGNVLIYVHKEEELPEVFARFPADHYVVIDDKPRILSTLEECCPTTFTTILVRQGKYGQETGYAPKPDWVVDHIGDVRHFTEEQFLKGTGAPSGTA